MEVSTIRWASLRVNEIFYSYTVQCEKDKGAALAQPCRQWERTDSSYCAKYRGEWSSLRLSWIWMWQSARKRTAFIIKFSEAENGERYEEEPLGKMPALQA
jgi:hypothetical protein